MKQLLFTYFVISSLLIHSQEGSKNILPADIQIKIAVQAAPFEFREDSTVLGYNPEGQLVVLREGTNEFICLAPNYQTPQHFSSYCYPKSLEPFMKRGRELEAIGKAKEKNKIRAKEYEDGNLIIPDGPTPLYVYWGSLKGLDETTGEMSDAKRRYVLYLPNAKASDYGLSNKPNNLGIPWLMDEGTYKAHIMITPPHQH